MSSSDDVKKFTLAEVAKNKDPKGPTKEVWIVLHDHVYNVTKFLDEVRHRINVTKMWHFLRHIFQKLIMTKGVNSLQNVVKLHRCFNVPFK